MSAEGLKQLNMVKESNDMSKDCLKYGIDLGASKRYEGFNEILVLRVYSIPSDRWSFTCHFEHWQSERTVKCGEEEKGYIIMAMSGCLSAGNYAKEMKELVRMQTEALERY